MSKLPKPLPDHKPPTLADLPLFGPSPVNPPEGAGPSYPEYQAEPHITLYDRLNAWGEALAGTMPDEDVHVKKWALALQGMMPPGPPEPEDGDQDQDSPTEEIPKEQFSFDMMCPGWAAIGECENMHVVCKAILCNREWCQGWCGGLDGPAHNRRKASWLPKARQIHEMGRWVLTIPPELRPAILDDPQKELGRLGTAAKRMMQRHGYDRGLRRWHYYGEPENAPPGEYPQFHPHLEILVDGGYLSPESIEAVKRSWANILMAPVARINVYYEYVKPHDTRRKLHRVGYALRPTFLDWRWSPELADLILGFRNANTWGKWDGDPVWDVPPDPDAPTPSPEVIALESGHCPECQSKIKWLGVIDITAWQGGHVPPAWRELGEGYYAGYI